MNDIGDIEDICEYCNEEVKSVYCLFYKNIKGEMEYHFGHKSCLSALKRMLEERDNNL